MKLFNDVAVEMQRYYLERDFVALQTVIELIKGEIDDPELQAATITVAGKMDVLEQLINETGFLRMNLDEADSSGPVQRGKLIRVLPTNRVVDDGCMILNVAHIDENEIILVPPGGGTL